MNNVFLYLDANSVNDKNFNFELGNPGVGGTEFLTVQLFDILDKGIGAQLVTNNNFTIRDEEPSSLVRFNSIEEDIISHLKENDVIVFCQKYLRRVGNSVFKKIRAKGAFLVCWVHHPHLTDTYALKYFDKVVTIGEYQHLSNLFISDKLVKIRNLFYQPKVNLDNLENCEKSSSNVVYLGGLISGKGFHKTLPIFASLAKADPLLKFHVIGSSSTYSGDDLHSNIPAEPKYAKDIERLLHQYDIKDKVIFYGNVGVEKIEIIKKCRFAIINPTGRTEAFPASVLELMSAGCVVFAGSDYGLKDVMSLYPLNSLTEQKNVVNQFEYYKVLSNYRRYTDYVQLHLRSVEQANVAIINQWKMLLAYPEISMASSPLSKRKFFIRYIMQCLKIFIRKINL